MYNQPTNVNQPTDGQPTDEQKTADGQPTDLYNTTVEWTVWMPSSVVVTPLPWHGLAAVVQATLAQQAVDDKNTIRWQLGHQFPVIRRKGQIAPSISDTIISHYYHYNAIYIVLVWKYLAAQKHLREQNSVDRLHNTSIIDLTTRDPSTSPSIITLFLKKANMKFGNKKSTYIVKFNSEIVKRIWIL